MNALQQDTIAKLGFDPGEYEFSADDITFILAFREVVNAKPEFVAACAYVQYEDSKPGQTPFNGAPVAPLCVIGSVVYVLNPVTQTLVDMSGWEGEAGSTVLSQVSRLKNLTARVIAAADRAQFEQDNGMTWGEVLEQFELRLRGQL